MSHPRGKSSLTNMDEIADLLQKIHRELFYAELDQAAQQAEAKGEQKSKFGFFSDIFKSKDNTLEQKIKCLSLCRDYLRNENESETNKLPVIIAKAPSDLKDLYNQCKKFNASERDAARNFLNDQGMVTLSPVRKSR